MPRKSKVTAVPIEQPKEVEQVIDEKTDAEQMTEIVKEIDEPVVEPVIEPVIEPVVEQAVKPTKAKRAPRAKKEPIVEPVVEINNEPVVELNNEPEVPKVKKEIDKVECPDCGKRMSAKTLRYSHIPNCLFKKQADKEEALIKESEGKCVMTISDEVIEAEVQKRMSSAKAERLNRRQKQIECLIANAF